MLWHGAMVGRARLLGSWFWGDFLKGYRARRREAGEAGR